MTTYQYKARDKFGKAVQGVMEADSEQAVSVKLGQMGHIPITIKPGKGLQGELQINKIFERFKRVKFTELNMFTRQLFTLQNAGLPLLSSLMALKEQTINPIFKEAIEQTARDIEGGLSLSAALAKHPGIFNALYVNMVKSGEVSGRLGEILERLATLGEHEEKILLRIKAATRYPMIVVTTIVTAFLGLVTLIIPRFAKLYAQFETALPLPTQILLGIHYTITRLWWLVILLGVALVFLFRKLISNQEGLSWWDGLKLKVPIFGPLTLKLSMSRFCRITGTLMRSGVPILQILELVSESAGNKVISTAIDRIQASVNEGKGMLVPMKMSGLFPPLVIQMVAVGEETGKVDELLLHVSDYYDSQIDYTINNLVALIEPILIFALGIMVLFLALGIFMPMWNMMSLFRK